MKFALFVVENGVPAVGARYVSGAMAAAGHDSRMIFLPKDFNDFETESEVSQIQDWLKSEKPEMVGVSLMSNHFKRVVHLTECFRKLDDFLIVWGGVHPTCVPESCLDHTDIVCIGESEDTIVELAARHSRCGPYHDIAGLCYRQEGEIVRTPIRAKKENLDDVPWQDQNKNKHMILHNGVLHHLTDDIMRHYIYACNGMHFIMTSRGCPRHCSFCCNDKLMAACTGSRVRRRSIRNVMDEVHEALRTYNFISSFAFWDDAFLCCDKEWLEEFCETYRSEIGLPFFCNLHPREATPERIKMLVDAGLMGIQMGLQSGSLRVNRDVFDRDMSVLDFENAARLIHQHRKNILDRHYHVIVDNPWETEDEKIASLELLNRIGRPFYISRLSLMFYPATRLYERAIEEGLISENENDVFVREYYEHKRSYVNFLMRISQVAPPWLVAFFLKNRKNKIVRVLFYAYYYGYYSARYRLFNQFWIGRIRKKLWRQIPGSAEKRLVLLKSAIRFRPL